VKERILHTLCDLRNYALQKGYEISLFYHEEDSFLMRFANSAISLNTHEHLIHLEIEAYAGKQRASYALITNLDKVDEMKQGIDTAAEMVAHTQPLSYQPTIPKFSSSFEDESSYDAPLAQVSNAEKLDYFNRAAAGLESEDLRLSGIFSCGESTVAQINTRSQHTQFFRMSDAQITAVLAHARLKWEMIAEQSAQKKTDLEPSAIREDLAFLLHHYQHDTQQQIPPGSYDMVFGSSAIAQLLRMMSFIGFNGGLMKRGYSFLSEEKIGQQVFSQQFTLVDDPSRRETYPYKQDYMGIPRSRFPIVHNGVFQGFTWIQDDADEFGAKATGHTVQHTSLALQEGDKAVGSLEELVAMPRERDILYIPYLHYMNIVNPSAGIVTASSRFGALLLKKDGSVEIPYNVRLTQSLLDIFGDRVGWQSQATLPYNISNSYGSRNPTAIVVPRFMLVKDLQISHSNPSF
jgi:predicted Zn-dependent protease